MAILKDFNERVGHLSYVHCHVLKSFCRYVVVKGE